MKYLHIKMKVIAVLFAIATVASAVRQFKNDQVLRITPTSDSQVKILAGLEKKWPDIDYWTDLHGSRAVDIHIPAINLPSVKIFLTRNRIDFTVFIADLQTAIDEQTSSRPEQMNLATFDYNVYHTLDEINAWMDDIISTYSMVSEEYLGNTFEERPMRGLKISNGVFFKPAFVITCGLHAREWVGPSTCLHSIKYLLEGSGGNILNEVDFYFVPVSNPDGYKFTWEGDRMWRKTRSTYSSNLCVGVDPNRNWDINWSGPGASSSPCNDAFYGPSEFSEVEVRNIRDWIGSLPYVEGYIDIHAYYQYWMYPYAYTYGLSIHDSDLRSIALDSVNAIGAVHGKTYTYGRISEVIYQSSGSSSDYVYEKLKVKCSFAAELRDNGLYGFTLPERYIQPTAEETFAGLMVIAQNIEYGNCIW